MDDNSAPRREVILCGWYFLSDRYASFMSRERLITTHCAEIRRSAAWDCSMASMAVCCIEVDNNSTLRGQYALRGLRILNGVHSGLFESRVEDDSALRGGKAVCGFCLLNGR